MTNRKTAPLRTFASRTGRGTSDQAPKAFKTTGPGLSGALRLARHHRAAALVSAESGRSASFRVEVDPDGTTTITPLEGFGAPGNDAADPLAAARERGRIQAAEILAGDDMLGADAFAKMLGTTRMTVNTKRKHGEILGLEGAKRGFRFPAWQIGRDGKPYPELKTLHETLDGPWAVWRFLTTPEGALGGLTGREALARGKGKAALLVAEGIARGSFG